MFNLTLKKISNLYFECEKWKLKVSSNLDIDHILFKFI